jgi:CBS domain containing-hemolysin-like protein
LEDVLEELLQEEIYDEKDQMEKEAEKIALWVGRRWRRKAGGAKSMGTVVEELRERTSETTSLLGRTP